MTNQYLDDILRLRMNCWVFGDWLGMHTHYLNIFDALLFSFSLLSLDNATFIETKATKGFKCVHG
jgi:hypothetical protein